MLNAREEFESFVRRGTREGEDFLERDKNGDYVSNVAKGGWAACRERYLLNKIKL